MLSDARFFRSARSVALAVAFALLVQSPLPISADILEHDSGPLLDDAESAIEAAQQEAPIDESPRIQMPVTPSRVEQALDRINGYRGAAGLAPLQVNEDLSRAAFSHTEEMARRSLMTHTSADGKNPFERARAQGYRGRAVAEVVAMGFADGDQVVAAWMASPEHGKVLLAPRYRDISVRVAESPNGLMFWTADLGIPQE